MKGRHTAGGFGSRGASSSACCGRQQCTPLQPGNRSSWQGNHAPPPSTAHPRWRQFGKLAARKAGQARLLGGRRRLCLPPVRANLRPVDADGLAEGHPWLIIVLPRLGPAGLPGNRGGEEGCHASHAMPCCHAFTRHATPYSCTASATPSHAPTRHNPATAASNSSASPAPITTNQPPPGGHSPRHAPQRKAAPARLPAPVLRPPLPLLLQPAPASVPVVAASTGAAQ